MDTSGQPTLRTPIVLLALVNLALLGARLWPWQNVMNLPGNGTTGFDPAVTLVAYAGLGFWIGSVRTAVSKKSLFSAAMMGVLAGAFLVGLVLVASRQTAEETSAPDKLQIGLAVCAALVLGAAGWRTATVNELLSRPSRRCSTSDGVSAGEISTPLTRRLANADNHRQSARPTIRPPRPCGCSMKYRPTRS